MTAAEPCGCDESERMRLRAKLANDAMRTALTMLTRNTYDGMQEARTVLAEAAATIDAVKGIT